jgi:hypothetical protein
VKVLDLTAGNRACWFDRNDARATFVDIRESVEPSVVADACSIPAAVGDGFDLVVFDPPHKNNGAASGMQRSYGHSDAAAITRLLSGAAREAHRVSRSGALMLFKWNDHTRKLATVLPLLAPYWRPMLAHGLKHQQERASQSFWCALTREDAAS